jgi:hypothetical protein
LGKSSLGKSRLHQYKEKLGCIRCHLGKQLVSIFMEIGEWYLVKCQSGKIDGTKHKEKWDRKLKNVGL